MKTKRILFMLFVALAQILAACAPAASTPNPVSVIQGYYDALEARDVDKVMSFVAEDAVFRAGDQFAGPGYAGQEEIRLTLQSAINDRVTVEVSNISNINGRLVYECQVFVNGAEAGSGMCLTIVKDSKIIFDGTEVGWVEECERDPTKKFCAE